MVLVASGFSGCGGSSAGGASAGGSSAGGSAPGGSSAGGSSAGGPSTGTSSAGGSAPGGSSAAAARQTRPEGAAPARGPRGTEAVPVLMYHVINPAPAGAPFPGLYVSAGEFAEQMAALARAGFHAVTMDQVWANWHGGTPLPPGRPVVLTFDNGYHSQYANALPILRRMGWVGVENIQLTGLPPAQGGLSPGEVRGLLAAGWELDTQGISHADLIALDPAALHEQVAVARAELQRMYGVPVNWFCYPSGHYDATVLAAVRAAGYRGSTTVVPGWASPGEDPYRLPRLRVLGGTSGAQLVAEIAAIRREAPPPASYR